MGFKTQSVFTATYTNTTFTITESMGISSVSVVLLSGSATILGGLQFPGLTPSTVPLTVTQSVTFTASQGYTLEGITVDSTAGGVFEMYVVYDYNNAIDPSALAFITATGMTGTTQINAIDTLVKSLKATNLWSSMKAIYPFVTDNVNLLSYTNQLNNPTYYTSFNALTTTSSVVTPNNDTSAFLFTTTSNDNNKIWNLPPITAPSTTLTLSTYLKYNNATWGFFQIWGGGGQDGATQWINLQTGTLGTSSSTSGYTVISSTINNVGNGWYNVTLTATVPINSNVYCVFEHVISNGAFNFSSVNGLASYIWHPQIQTGSTATSYQEVTGSAQTYITNQFKYNLVNPVNSDSAFRLVFNGGWNMSNLGATPNGTNGYADTKCNLTNANSGHLSFYSRTNSVFTSCSMGGVGSGGSQSALFLTYASNQTYLRINSAGTTTPISTANSLGYFVANRISSTGTRNFVQSSIISQTDASIGVQNTNNYIGALSGSGTPNLYDNKQCAFSTIGDGLTDAQALNLYNIVQTFQTALSRQV
jgi:hypothetical protein